MNGVNVNGDILPNDWQPMPLGSLLREVNCKVGRSGNTDVPILSMTRHQGLILQSDKFEKRVASRDISSYKLVQENQIVVGFPIDEGVIYALRRFPLGAVSPAYQVWELISNVIDVSFLDRMLKTPYMLERYRQLSSLTVQRRRSVGKQDFLSISIPVPPLPEQRRISAVLNTIQDAIAAQEDVIAAAKEFKRSLMHRLFTVGPGREPAPTKETEIGEIPAHWEVAPLSEAISETQYGLNSRAELAGTYPVLRMNNLVAGKIDISDLKYVELEPDELSRYRLNRDDILFNRTNSYELVGKTALFDQKDIYTFASYLVRVVAKTSKAVPAYLNSVLNAEHTQQRLKRLATRGASQSNISPTKLKTLLVALPPVPEQEQMTEMLDAADSKIAAEEDRLTALQALFKSMLHQLMTGQIRLLSDEGLPLA
ncbi:MAG: restriction endonuclease subunit S [Caldilineaceae bacterium]